MFTLKIVLIILMAAPVIAIATVLYIQLLKYVISKNREDRMAGRK